MQGDVAWCECKERWLRGSATFYLPSTIGAMPRNAANGAGRGPSGCSVPASHFRTAHCPRRITSCCTRWWLTNVTKAYRLPFGKALALEDPPSFSHCTLLALLQLTNLSTPCFFFNFLLCLPFFYLSLHISFEMVEWRNLLPPVGKMHIHCGSSIAERSFQKLRLQCVRPNTKGCATAYHLVQSNSLISCNVAFALIKQHINCGIIQTGNCS